MKHLFRLTIVSALTAFSVVRAAETWKYTVQLSATVQESPPQIELTWPADPNNPDSYTVYRKSRDATSWGTGTTLPGTATSFTDTDVTVGVPYEYQVSKTVTGTTPPYKGYGYIYSGIDVPATENRGKLVLIVATNSTQGLASELDRLKTDLIGDGWLVLRHDVSSNDTPAHVHGLITGDYSADPSNVKAVFLLGHVPILHVGNLNYDGHEARPMPADAYYGDVYGDWSSSPNYLPSDVELMVGRVDLFDMPGVGSVTTWPNETELLRNYLNKDHKWRTGEMSAPRLALMGDRREEEGGLATAATGYRNFDPLVGHGNTVLADVSDNGPVTNRWISMLSSNRYLMAYGCGGGDPKGCSGLGTNGPYNLVYSDDVVDSDAHAVFVFVFGSWFGNWDVEDNFLRSFLATPTMGLEAAMAGQPHWYLHHMGLGEPIGFSTRLSMNNGTLYTNQINLFARANYTALMGDPTLRLDPVQPASNLIALRSGGAVQLNWSASPDSVAGYYVYRADSPDGPFTRLDNSLVTTTSYTDNTPGTSPYTYMVRAVKLQTTPSGTYYNPSEGIFADAMDDPVIQVMANPGPNGVVLTWNSELGVEYRVLAATNLIQPTWQDISGSVIGSGATTSWTDTNSVNGVEKFYRVTTSLKVAEWMNTLLSPQERMDLLLTNMTVADKLALRHGAPGPYVGNIAGNPAGIHGLRLQDGPAGIADGLPNVTAFPAPIMLAATWNTDLARQYGKALGEEARAKGVDVLLGPLINMARVPQGGRDFESFGEDPKLSADIAAPYIRGVQSQKVIACAKAFIANDQEANRGNINAVVGDRALREIYLPPFRSAVHAGVGSIMSAYNLINGEWSSDSPLLRTVLRDAWGFDGFVVCDWGANFDTVQAITNGLDLEMPAGQHYGNELANAVANGDVPVSYLDQSVRHILNPMFRFDMIDHPSTAPAWDSVGITQDHVQVARDVAAEGIVLLKNANKLLPLSETNLHSIAVSGSAAYDTPIWTGNGSAQVFYFPYYDAPLDAISNRAGAGVSISYVAGDSESITQAVQQAAQSDVAIVCVGEQTGEGTDRTTLSLPDDQDALVSAIAATNRHTIVVLYSGAGTLMPWLNQVDAVIEAWYPGLEGAGALASVLFGDVDPSGRLPLTFPASANQFAANTPSQYPGTNLVVNYSEGLLMGYRWYDASNAPPLFPFGHGLSYTTFGYSNLTMSAVSPAGEVSASFDLWNAGSRAGAEVAQLYLGFPATAGEPPKQLKAFQKLNLAPGETNRVTMNLDWRDLAYWNANSQSWTVPPGTFQVMIGASSRDIRLTNSFSVILPVPSSRMQNLALFRPVAVSSEAGAEFGGARAVDGDPETGWQSLPTSPQWMTLDLGSVTKINRLVLNWGPRYAGSYVLRTSDDNLNWTDLYSTSTGGGGREELLVNGSGRYLQLYNFQSPSGWGYTLDELEVYAPSS